MIFSPAIGILQLELFCASRFSFEHEPNGMTDFWLLQMPKMIIKSELIATTYRAWTPVQLQNRGSTAMVERLEYFVEQS